MNPGSLAIPCLAALVALNPAAAALAGPADAIVGGIIGGIISGAIASQPRVVRRSSSRPAVSSAQREQNRAVQTALNYFDFPAGTPDGAIGPRSRAAISQFQGFLGYPATGTLTEFERTILLTAHQWGLSGSPDALRLAAGVQGTRALLVAQRDHMAGGRPTVVAGMFGGLPPEVAESVMEIARNTSVEPEQLMQRHGFIQLADINGDGRTDYILDTSVTGSAFWCSAQACTVRVFASTPDGHQRNDFQAFNVTPAMFACQQGHCLKVGTAGSDTTIAVAPAPQTPPALPPVVAAAAAPAGAAPPALPVPSAVPVVANPAASGAPALPTFMAQGALQPSLASHCNRVSLVTNTNGGFVTLATLADPRFALSEQFCLARTYAMAQAEEIMARLTGITPREITEQCRTLGPALREPVAALSLSDRETVLREVSAFVLATGMAPAQLAGTARVCLGVGYTTDDMEVAIGSALLLTVLGEGGYGELLGHHLVAGFGATERPEMALPWFEASLAAAGAGGAMVFAPGMPDRAELLRVAALRVAGREAAATQPAAAPVFAIPRIPGLSAGN